MPEPTTLTDEQVAEIEALKPFQYGTMVNLTVAQRDALCATVRAAWAIRDQLSAALSVRDAQLAAVTQERDALREAYSRATETEVEI